MIKYALAAATILLFMSVSQAAMPVQECLTKAKELETGAMKKAPRGEEEVFKDFLKKTMNDVKMLCLKEDADGTVRMIYNRVCPRFEMCDKIKILVDSGVSQRHKDCIDSALKEIES